jgi:N-acetylglucosamine-6-phosphate deacetylase
MNETLLIRSCRPVGHPENDDSMSILIRSGKIEGVQTLPEIPPETSVLDAGGRLIAPGFIDVHIQGAGGFDVLHDSEEGLETISRTCARYGVTGFLATTVYRHNGRNHHLRTAARCTEKNLGGARLLGIHLEGPFISPLRRGMIQPGSVCPPSPDVLSRILDLAEGTLQIMTIAPEVDGALKLIERLKGAGTVPSFGHSAASYERTRTGIAAGICHVTHLFNAMSGMHHRNPGPLPALVESDVTAQLIPDGVHVHPPVVRLACRLFGPERLVAITDAMQAMGLPDGEYVYDGIRYHAKDGTARYGDGTLIGTAVGMDELVRRLRAFGDLSRDQALGAASANAARVLGLEGRMGTIAPGMEADLTVLNNDLSVHATIVSGKVVYEE